MAKAPTLPNITGQFASSGQLNQAFRDIEDAFENTISRDGSLPNTMEADLDLNGNSLLNVDTIDVDNLSIAGQAVVDLASVPEWRSTWTSATTYVQNDLVKQNGDVYICLVPHVSGTFSTDLSALRWELFVQRGAAGAGTGDMLRANNLNDVTNIDTARANIGAQASNSNLTSISSLTDPNADRILFWDDSAGNYAWLTPSTGLAVSGTDISVSPNLASLSGLSLAQGDLLYATGPNTVARLPRGSANQLLRINSGGTLPEWGGGGLTLGTSQATTSGTAFDFTSIPATARRVRVILSGVSWGATAALRFQLGDSGGFETTGYTGTSSTQNASSNTFAAASAGFETTATVLAGDTISGAVTFTNITGNVWVADGVFAIAGGQTLTAVLAGTKTLSDVLDRVRVTSVAGATFDAGTVNISWE